MRSNAQDERADVRDMAIVHQVYRREFALAPLVLRELLPEDEVRRAAAQEWFPVTLVAMHHHHVAEDDLMYPLMHGTVPQHLLDLMETEHRAVDAAVRAVEGRLDAWIAGELGADEALARSYEQLLPVLTMHLDHEEELIVPLIGDSMSAEQYGRMATSGNDMYEPRMLMLCFGAMIEQCSEQDAQFMLSHLRPEVRASWHNHVAEEYRDLMALIRGSLQPNEPTYQKAANR